MWGYRQKGSGAGSGENISDIAPWLDPARPARLNLIRVLGQQDFTRTHSPRSRFGVRLVRFPSGNLACRETVVRARRELQARSSAGQDIPTPLCTPEAWEEENQAGVIIRTDSQRNVSRGNRVCWAIFRGQALHPIFEIFRHPLGHPDETLRCKHRSVRVGSPAARSGATIPGWGETGAEGPIPALSRPLAPHRGLGTMPRMVGDGWSIRCGAGGQPHRLLGGGRAALVA